MILTLFLPDLRLDMNRMKSVGLPGKLLGFTVDKRATMGPNYISAHGYWHRQTTSPAQDTLVTVNAGAVELFSAFRPRTRRHIGTVAGR